MVLSSWLLFRCTVGTQLQVLATGKAQNAPYEPCTTVGKGTILLPGAKVMSTYGGVSPSSGGPEG